MATSLFKKGHPCSRRWRISSAFTHAYNYKRGCTRKYTSFARESWNHKLSFFMFASTRSKQLYSYSHYACTLSHVTWLVKLNTPTRTARTNVPTNATSRTCRGTAVHVPVYGAVGIILCVRVRAYCGTTLSTVLDDVPTYCGKALGFGVIYMYTSLTNSTSCVCMLEPMRGPPRMRERTMHTCSF